MQQKQRALIYLILYIAEAEGVSTGTSLLVCNGIQYILG